MGKIRGKFSIQLLLIPFICACHNDHLDKDFFKNFMRWKDMDGNFVFESQGKYGDVGYGKILLEDGYVDVRIQFCPRSGTKMVVAELDESYCLEKGLNKSCSITFDGEKVKSKNGGYFEDQIKLSYVSNNFDSSFWENKTITLFAEKIDKDDLDASLFEDLNFTVNDLDIDIKPLNNHWDEGRNPLKWIFNFKNHEYQLTFDEKRTFKIEGDITTFGSYIPDYEFLTLNFDNKNIFDSTTLVSVLTYNF